LMSSLGVARLHLAAAFSIIEPFPLFWSEVVVRVLGAATLPGVSCSFGDRL